MEVNQIRIQLQMIGEEECELARQTPLTQQIEASQIMGRTQFWVTDKDRQAYETISSLSGIGPSTKYFSMKHMLCSFHKDF